MIQIPVHSVSKAYVRCSEHEDLELLTDWEGAAPGLLTLYLRPCPACLEEAEKRGRLEGIAEEQELGEQKRPLTINFDPIVNKLNREQAAWIKDLRERLADRDKRIEELEKSVCSRIDAEARDKLLDRIRDYYKDQNRLVDYLGAEYRDQWPGKGRKSEYFVDAIIRILGEQKREIEELMTQIMILVGGPRHTAELDKAIADQAAEIERLRGEAKARSRNVGYWRDCYYDVSAQLDNLCPRFLDLRNKIREALQEAQP